jgi:hypothetical protein
VIDTDGKLTGKEMSANILRRVYEAHWRMPML